jgi:hypothetical protein
MEIPGTMKAILVTIVFICLVIAGVAIGALVMQPAPDDLSPASVPGNQAEGMTTLTTPFPKSPETAPIYNVTKKVEFTVGGPKLMETKTSIPSEDDAPALAEKALEKYGGLPGDAVLKKVERITLKKYNTATGTVEAEYPQRTEVIYTQQLAGHPVVGPGAEIIVALGENGELLQVNKVWRSLEYDREIPIISAEEAFEKLKRLELMEIPQCCINGLVVSDIQLGYYAEDRDHDQEYLYPIWIFYGTPHPEIDQSRTPFIVDARKHEVGTIVDTGKI